MRTEKEILKDFEKLGYKFTKSPVMFSLINSSNTKRIYIHIDTNEYTVAGSQPQVFNVLTMQEHKLLHELFECWGWI